MAVRRISSLLNRSFISSVSLLSRGTNSYVGRGIGQYSTAAAIEEPIKPPVSVNYTELLIDGQLVNAASGKYAQVTNNPDNDGCINVVLFV